MNRPPTLPAPRPFESYPHRFSVYFLSLTAERRFLETILKALEFTAQIESAPQGLSGLAHPPHLVGLNSSTKHAVVCQSGFQTAFTLKLPSRRPEDLANPTRDESLPEREDRIRRNLLFSGYDLRAKFESEGWTTDVLYFLNASSPEEGGVDLGTLARPDGTSPPSVQYYKSGSTVPIPRIPLAELRRNAISTGACFVDLSDVRREELAAILQTSPEEALVASAHMLKRLRLSQYFRPPIDELLLGTLAKSPQGLSPEQLGAAPHISSALNHPPSQAQHIAPVDYSDPLAVVKALEAEKRLRIKGSLAFTTDQGAQVAYEFEKSAEESWVQRILKLLPLVKFLAGSK